MTVCENWRALMCSAVRRLLVCLVEYFATCNSLSVALHAAVFETSECCSIEPSQVPAVGGNVCPIVATRAARIGCVPACRTTVSSTTNAKNKLFVPKPRKTAPMRSSVSSDLGTNPIPAPNASPPTKRRTIHQVMCVICHPYSAHLFERLDAPDGLTMTLEFCATFFEACSGELGLSADYCDVHTGGGEEDQYWSYPLDLDGECSVRSSCVSALFSQVDRVCLLFSTTRFVSRMVA